MRKVLGLSSVCLVLLTIFNGVCRGVETKLGGGETIYATTLSDIFGDLEIDRQPEKCEDGLKMVFPEVLTAKNATLDSEEGWDVNVLVVGDEEMRSNWWLWWNWKGYTEYQIERSLYYAFGLRYKVWIECATWIEWDSNDNNDAYELLQEMVAEIGWKSGNYYDGVRCDILIGWTNQQSFLDTGVVGLTWVGKGVILVHPIPNGYYAWADDNLIVHEVSHLYNTEHHRGDNCVMNQYDRPFIFFVSENWRLYWILDQVPSDLLTYSHCRYCYGIIYSCRDKYGRWEPDAFKGPDFPWSHLLFPTWSMFGHASGGTRCNLV